MAKWTDTGLQRNLAMFDPKMREAIVEMVTKATKEAEARAKADAVWTNHTWKARTSLEGIQRSMGDQYGFILTHGAEYGIYLETHNEKRFAIILETLYRQGQNLMQDFEDSLMRRSV